jgi:hypothetical protein
MVAAQNMHMRPLLGTFKYPGYQNIVNGEGYAADRAEPLQIAANAVQAAAYMHQAVFAPGYGRKSQRLNQLAAFQLGRTDGTGLRIAGGERHFLQFLPAGPAAPYRQTPENETVSKLQQNDADNHKSQ